MEEGGREEEEREEVGREEEENEKNLFRFRLSYLWFKDINVNYIIKGN